MGYNGNTNICVDGVMKMTNKTKRSARHMRNLVLRRVISVMSVTLVMFLIVCYSVNAIAGRDETTVVTVRPGDTLWAIAEKYGDHTGDIREFIYNIKRLNGLQSSAVSPGQVLVVPIR